MKKFDLEEAKAGKPLVTRDGRSARFLAHISEAEEGYSVLVFVKGQTMAQAHFDNGTYLDDGQAYDDDLFMATTKRTLYVNFYHDGDAKYHRSVEAAKEYFGPEAIAIAVPVEIED